MNVRTPGWRRSWREDLPVGDFEEPKPIIFAISQRLLETVERTHTIKTFGVKSQNLAMFLAADSPVSRRFGKVTGFTARKSSEKAKNNKHSQIALHDAAKAVGWVAACHA